MILIKKDKVEGLILAMLAQILREDTASPAISKGRRAKIRHTKVELGKLLHEVRQLATSEH